MRQPLFSFLFKQRFGVVDKHLGALVSAADLIIEIGIKSVILNLLLLKLKHIEVIISATMLKKLIVIALLHDLAM